MQALRDSSCCASRQALHSHLALLTNMLHLPCTFCLLQLERRAEQLAAAAAERKRLEAEVAELKAAQQAQQAQQVDDEEDEEDAAAAAEVIGVLKQQLQAAQQAAAKVGGGIVVGRAGQGGCWFGLLHSCMEPALQGEGFMHA